eukprot:scaffold20929_cov30-Tisochrysis_lutea.AAC.3
MGGGWGWPHGARLQFEARTLARALRCLSFKRYPCGEGIKGPVAALDRVRLIGGEGGSEVELEEVAPAVGDGAGARDEQLGGGAG